MTTTQPKPWTPDRIRTLRSRLEWTQADLARELRYSSAGVVAQIEGGRRNPSGAAQALLDIIDAHDGLPA